MPDSPTPGDELDQLADALDLKRLTKDQFIDLLVVVHMLGEADAGVHLSSMSSQSLVNLMAKASKDQLRALAEHPVLRPFIIDEIFRRMSDHLIAEKVRDQSVVISWQFLNGNVEPASYDVYQTVIEDGICSSAEDLGREPDTTVTLSVYDFIKMATGGNAAAAAMFVRGKVKVKGDYALAATFSNYFNIPKPN